MVEYSSVVAAISALVLALGAATVNLKGLPVSPGPAAKVVASAARSAGVDPAVARRALATAPYRRTELRTLYAVAFVNARKSAQKCAEQEVFGPQPVGEIVAAMKTEPDVVARLRTARIPLDVAARALQRGAVAGCA